MNLKQYSYIFLMTVIVFVGAIVDYKNIAEFDGWAVFALGTVLIPSTYVFAEKKGIVTLIHCVLAFLFGYSLLEVLPIILRIFFSS